MKLSSSCLISLAASVLIGTAPATAADSLEAGFQHPPDSAKPQTWWHWMNGNITKEGITADLEAMKRVGVGGAQIFNADCGIPAGPVKFMSAERREMFKHAVQEADRLGLQLCVHNCAGWSSSGGPWNTPEHAMQQIVTSETAVKGPASFSDMLPQPTTHLGFYRDIAVLAFPLPPAERAAMKDFSAKASLSTGEDPGTKLTDGDASTYVTLPLPTSEQIG